MQMRLRIWLGVSAGNLASAMGWFKLILMDICQVQRYATCGLRSLILVKVTDKMPLRARHWIFRGRFLLILALSAITIDRKTSSIACIMLPSNLRCWCLLHFMLILTIISLPLFLLPIHCFLTRSLSTIFKSSIGLDILPLLKLAIVFLMVTFNMNVVHQVLGLLPHLNLARLKNLLIYELGLLDLHLILVVLALVMDSVWKARGVEVYHFCRFKIRILNWSIVVKKLRNLEVRVLRLLLNVVVKDRYFFIKDFGWILKVGDRLICLAKSFRVVFSKMLGLTLHFWRETLLNLIISVSRHWSYWLANYYLMRTFDVLYRILMNWCVHRRASLVWVLYHLFFGYSSKTIIGILRRAWLYLYRLNWLNILSKSSQRPNQNLWGAHRSGYLRDRISLNLTLISWRFFLRNFRLILV